MSALRSLIPFRSLVLAATAFAVGCGGAEFSSTDNSAAGAAGVGEQAGNGGSTGPDDAAAASDVGTSGSGGTQVQPRDGSAGATGLGGATGHGGAGGMSGIVDAAVCPPCAAPPNPSCVGQGICGCGPYVCPEAGRDAAVEASGPPCGGTVCPLGKLCCNALKGICTLPGVTCIQ